MKVLLKYFRTHSNVHLTEVFNSEKDHAVFKVIRYAWFQTTHFLNCGKEKTVINYVLTASPVSHCPTENRFVDVSSLGKYFNNNNNNNNNNKSNDVFNKEFKKTWSKHICLDFLHSHFWSAFWINYWVHILGTYWINRYIRVFIWTLHEVHVTYILGSTIFILRAGPHIDISGTAVNLKNFRALVILHHPRSTVWSNWRGYFANIVPLIKVTILSNAKLNGCLRLILNLTFCFNQFVFTVLHAINSFNFLRCSL